MPSGCRVSDTRESTPAGVTVGGSDEEERNGDAGTVTAMHPPGALRTTGTGAPAESRRDTVAAPVWHPGAAVVAGALGVADEEQAATRAEPSAPQARSLSRRRTPLLGRGAGSRRGVDRLEPDPGPQRGGIGIGQLGVEGVVLALASGALPTASVTSRSGGAAR